MNTQDSSSQIAEDTQALLDATASTTQEAVVAARDRLKSALDAAGETYARVKAKAVAGAQATDKAIRENPYQAIGLALGLGALLGFLLSRNRD
jgi:ElaB/YqjD/DUF883 family membrane-anchored ribosome-binding protein